jgi:hypothetical protein
MQIGEYRNVDDSYSAQSDDFVGSGADSSGAQDQLGFGRGAYDYQGSSGQGLATQEGGTDYGSSEQYDMAGNAGKLDSGGGGVRSGLGSGGRDHGDYDESGNTGRGSKPSTADKLIGWLRIC